MKQVLVLLLLLAFSIRVSAQSWAWMKGADGGESEGYYCAVDPSGNVFSAGVNWDYMSFDTDTLIHPGVVSPFVVKYDSLGNELWARTTTGGSANLLGISADAFGNLYMLGAYDSTINISGYILSNSNPQPFQIFIAKYNSSGALIWAKNLGNVIASNIGQGCITTDNSGNIYIATTYYHDPALGAYSFANTDISNTTEDFLVAKLDSSGIVLWAKSFGGPNEDYATSITVTPSNQIYVCGNFYSTSLTFGGTTLLNTGTVLNHLAIFLTKLNSSGIPIWSIATGGNSPYNYAFGVASNPAEDVYMTGWFSIDTLTFGSYHLTTPPYVTHGYLVKYDSSGSALWVKDMRGENMKSWTVAVDPCDNTWIGGSMDTGTNDTIDGHILLAPPGSYDPMFLAGWSSAGTYLQAISLSSGGEDNNTLAIDKCGNIFVEGDYEHEHPFIVGTHSLIPSNNFEHNFIAKYNPNIDCTGSCNAVLYSPSYQADQVSIYPNPVNTLLTITSAEIISRVTLMNMVGQVITSYQGCAETMKINLAHLLPGMYYNRINGYDIRRFVKQ